MEEKYWGIRGSGKACCPEHDCGYGGFPQQERCRGCGTLHKECPNYKEKEV